MVVLLFLWYAVFVFCLNVCCIPDGEHYVYNVSCIEKCRRLECVLTNAVHFFNTLLQI